MRHASHNVFALYKGNKFIDIGTYKKIATNQHMNLKYLYSIRSKTPERLKNSRNAMMLIDL